MRIAVEGEVFPPRGIAEEARMRSRIGLLCILLTIIGPTLVAKKLDPQEIEQSRRKKTRADHREERTERIHVSYTHLDVYKRQVINHHQEVPFRVLERKYSFDENAK